MPDLRTVERFVGSVCRGKQDFTEAVGSETFLGRKGRADPLFVVASALWVAEKLPSVVTGDEFHGTGRGVCSALGAEQDLLPNGSFPLQSQQEEIGNNKTLHLEKGLLISTHLPSPLLSAPETQMS